VQGGVEITYPHHPWCGTDIVVLRRRKHRDEEMCDVADALGSRCGIPGWMMEPRWRELRISARPSVSREVLHALRGLLNALHSGSNEGTQLSFEGGSDEGTEAMRIAPATGELPETIQGREPAGTGAITGGTADPGAQE
jgi:hypothetical protein